MRDLTVTAVQCGLEWECPEANRDALGRVLADIAGTDLVVLPEMFTTGFSIASTAAAETMAGPTVRWLRERASAGGHAVVGSVKIVEDDRCYNRLLFVTPDGEITAYDKRHLFRMAGEHERYQAGRGRVVVNLAGWRLLLQVCYDLRFPVFSRNRDDYDAVIYVANWPAARRSAWQRLLPARAIENLAYCIGVNRVGQDGNGIDYAGDSVILDYIGDELAAAGAAATTISATLSAGGLARFRRKFPAHLDADEFRIDGV
ncbi:MAG: amidohydrolase [Pseudomonadota bacterium]